MSLEKITENLNALYPKDAKIASILIKDRRFYELKELVDSAIIILDKHLSRAKPPEEALAVNRKDLMKLKENVDSYLNKIDPFYSYESEDELDESAWPDPNWYFS